MNRLYQLQNKLAKLLNDDNDGEYIVEEIKKFINVDNETFKLWLKANQNLVSNINVNLNSIYINKFNNSLVIRDRDHNLFVLTYDNDFKFNERYSSNYIKELSKFKFQPIEGITLPSLYGINFDEYSCSKQFKKIFEKWLNIDVPKEYFPILKSYYLDTLKKDSIIWNNKIYLPSNDLFLSKDYDNDDILETKDRKITLIPKFKNVPELFKIWGTRIDNKQPKDDKFIYNNVLKQEIINHREFKLLNLNKINFNLIPLSSRPIVLGKGSDGMAFKINDTQVLKIFTSRFAFDKSIEAQERIFKNEPGAKNEAMIYDIGELGENVYYYIIELMKTKTETENIYQNLDLEEIIRFVENNYFRKKSLDDNKKYILNIFNQTNMASQIKADYNLKDNWLENLIEEIIHKINTGRTDLHTGRTDLHTGNIGVTNYGQLRFFDPVFVE